MKPPEEHNIERFTLRDKSKFKKAMYILKKRGISELGKSFIAMLQHQLRLKCAPYILALKKKETFEFNGMQLPYFYHKFGATWTTERCVEIAIGMHYVNKYKNRGKQIFEVGAVLPHYTNVGWDVLDKFEEKKGIINEDIVDYKSDRRYDLIISISTLEHIGYDDEKDPGKVLKAINNIKENCLQENGELIATIPINYNPYLDKYLFNEQAGFDRVIFMKRIDKKNHWKEVGMEEAKKLKYGSPFPCANCIAVGFFRKITKSRTLAPLR